MAGANAKAASSRRSSAKQRNHSSNGAPVKGASQNVASESPVPTFCCATQGRFRCAVRAVALANPTVRYCVLGTSGIGILFCCLEAYELISIIAGLTVIRYALPHVLKRGRAEQDLKTAAKLANLEGDISTIGMSEPIKAEDAEFASVSANSEEPTSDMSFGLTSLRNCESSNDSTAEATTGPIRQPVTDQSSELLSELSTCDDLYAEQSLPRSESSTAGSVRSESSDNESSPVMSPSAVVDQNTDTAYDALPEFGGPALAMTAWLRTGHPGQQEWEWTIMQPSSGNAEQLTPASMQTFCTGYRVVMKNGFLDECVAAPTAARRSRSM